MIKYLIKVAIILLMSTLSLFIFDDSTEIEIWFKQDSYILSPIQAFAVLFSLFLIIELFLFGLNGIIKLIKHDVLISNHDFFASKQNTDSSLNSNVGANDNTIVLSRNQFDEAAILIVKTIAAITAGVMSDAKRHLVCLRNIIGNDAVIDILKLKIFKGEKNFDKVEELSKKLMQNEDIQLVGMKAALEVQLEKKEFKEALQTANRAFEVRQDLYWVISTAFLLRAKSHDWLGALEVLEAGIEKNLTPPSKAKRLKSVALYELAKQAHNEGDEINFFKFITQALAENNKLIPAALDLAEYYIKNDKQKRKAQKVLYDMWIANPSYDVAMAYLELFKKDTVAEKIQRMENLAKVNSKNISLNNLLLAELYLNTKKYDKANTECKLFLLKNPATQKIAQIINTLDERKNKKKPETESIIKNIKKKIIHPENDFGNYPQDFQWVCANCGHMDSKWQPICPECGEIGRNYWHLYVDKTEINTDEE